jgi:DNA-binding MarR family transcriptional regulator
MEDRTMDEQQALTRPIGWWLKEADARIDEAFDRALLQTGLDRRRWQVLASLSRGPASQRDLTAALRRFDDDAAIDAVVRDLVDGGLVTLTDGDQLELTTQGRETQRHAAELVETVRQRVSAALDEDAYTRLVLLLAQLVEGLEQEPGASNRR